MSYAIADGFFIADANSLRVCRAIEMKSTGTGLSSSPDFRTGSAIGRPMVLQVFIHPRLVNDLHAMTAEIARTNPNITLPPPPAKPGRTPLRINVEPDTDGLSFEIHLPASLGMLAVISALSTPETLSMPSAFPTEESPAEPEPTTITQPPGARRPAILTNETMPRTRR